MYYRILPVVLSLMPTTIRTTGGGRGSGKSFSVVGLARLNLSASVIDRMGTPFKVILLASHLLAFAAVVEAQNARHPAAKYGQPGQGLREIERQVDAALARNETAQAIKLLREGVSLNPGWREGWWRLGTLLYQADSYPAARTAFDRLVELDPKAGAAWTLLGLCEFELSDYGPSLSHLQRGQALGLPTHLELRDVARYHQALALIVTEKYEQAQLLLNSFARQDQHTEEVLLAAGLAALHIPLLPRTLPQAVDSDRLSLIRQVGEAQHLAATKRYPEARQIYESSIQRFPLTSKLHYAYGALLSDLGELEKAEAEFRAELRVAPDSVLARIGLVYLGLQEDSVLDVLPLAQQAVRLEPKSYMAHYLLGRVLVKSDKIEEGTRELEISRDLEPNSSRVRYVLAQVYRRLRRKEDALREQKAFDRLRLIEDSIIQYGKLPASLFEPEKQDR